MSDKSKFTAPAPKPIKKRPSTVSVASSSRKAPSCAVKEKTPILRPKVNKNTTIIGEGDVTICKPEGSLPEFDALHHQIAYGKFLRTILEDCLVDEKIAREETEMDIMMSHLADRFQKTMGLLDKTNRRLKEISFMSEQKRLINLKSKDCTQFYDTLANASVKESDIEALNSTVEDNLNKLELKNIDFGFTKESGHKQLLDAVTDAITGLEDIKKHSNLDLHKFEEYEKAERNIKDFETERMDLETLKREFESKFPQFSEKLLKEASERIAEMIGNDVDDDD